MQWRRDREHRRHDTLSVAAAAGGETKRPDAVPVLAEYLTSEDESFRCWAVAGLQKIDTKEARRLLWEAEQRHLRPHADPSDTP
jgi:HEAT repeat protein